MSIPITKERWLEAQISERPHHYDEFDEPLIFEDSAKVLSSRKDLSFIRDPAETCEFPKADEAWLFNVLQHVIDPIKIIERCKENVKVIRFFEPIDTGCNLAHPHTFNFGFFARHFGQDNVKYFIGGSGGPVFHQNDCAYGVYHV